ncbi:MAG: porin [Pseudomonadota bacterium]
MKLKSLILGSAAAMMAFTGAQAADAIVAEPEPMEYVKVCETYGSGWHYIPGTETCLRFSGYVRTQYDWSEGSDRIGWGGRARFNIDVREETDYGTLRGFLRLQSDIVTTDGVAATGVATDSTVVLDQMYIELGGWFFGYADSNWVRNEYGGYTIFDGAYGYHQSNIIAYKYAANGFQAIISLERNFAQHRYAPNPLLHLSYAGSWGKVFAVGVLDLETGNTVAYAIKAGIQLNLDAIAPGDLFRLQGSWGNSRAPYLTGRRWEMLASFLHVFNSEWSIRFTYTTFDRFSNSSGSVQLRWNPVPNLSIRNEVRYINPGRNNWQWRARIVRSF